jgi:hypothetical protein
MKKIFLITTFLIAALSSYLAIYNTSQIAFEALSSGSTENKILDYMKTTHILIVLNLVITSGSLLFLLREMKK